MQNLIKAILGLLKYAILFLSFGGIYYAIEFVYKTLVQSSGIISYHMFFLGASCAVCFGLINNFFEWETNFWLQCFVCMLIVTLAEAIFGTYWISQGLYIWDYTHLPLSAVNGTINLFFSVAWFFLGGVAIILDDFLRNRLARIWNWIVTRLLCKYPDLIFMLFYVDVPRFGLKLYNFSMPK